MNLNNAQKLYVSIGHDMVVDLVEKVRKIKIFFFFGLLKL
jgi:hypothetical protein